MDHIQIQCQNCGAKYKIPESFKGDSAKCKQCGSVIDVTSQRQATASEAPAAKPDRSSARASGRRGSNGGARRGSSRRRRTQEEQPERKEPAATKAASAAGGRRRRGRRGGEEDDGDEQGGGRPRRERKKDATPIVVGSIIGVLAIVAVILIYTGWDKVTEKVKLPGQEEKYAAAQKRKAEEAEQERLKLKAAAEAERDRLAKEAADKAAAKKAKEASAKKKKATAKADKLEDIFDPSTLGKVPWTAAVKADQQKALDELVATAMESGLPGIRAQRKLEDAGWPALIPLTNKLMTFDYKTAKGNNDAFVLAQIVERITGWDPQMATMTKGEKVEVQVAHENALGVKQLHIKITKRWKNADDLKKWQKKNVK